MSKVRFQQVDGGFVISNNDNLLDISLYSSSAAGKVWDTIRCLTVEEKNNLSNVISDITKSFDQEVILAITKFLKENRVVD